MPKPGYTQSPEHKRKRLAQIEGDGNGSYKDGRRSYRRKAGAKNNDGTVVHHKNGDRTNNCASNLERLTDGDRTPGRRTTPSHEKHHGGRHGDSIAIRLAIRNDRKAGGCGKGKVGTGRGECKTARGSKARQAVTGSKRWVDKKKDYTKKANFNYRTAKASEASKAEKVAWPLAIGAGTLGIAGLVGAGLYLSQSGKSKTKNNKESRSVTAHSEQSPVIKKGSPSLLPSSSSDPVNIPPKPPSSPPRSSPFPSPVSPRPSPLGGGGATKSLSASASIPFDPVASKEKEPLPEGAGRSFFRTIAAHPTSKELPRYSHPLTKEEKKKRSQVIRSLLPAAGETTAKGAPIAKSYASRVEKKVSKKNRSALEKGLTQGEVSPSRGAPQPSWSEYKKENTGAYRRRIRASQIEDRNAKRKARNTKKDPLS